MEHFSSGSFPPGHLAGGSPGGPEPDPAPASAERLPVGPFHVVRLDAVPPRRHDHRVRNVSEDYGRLRRLDHVVVAAEPAERLVVAVCAATGTPEPILRFHARRSPFTGMTEAPRVIVEAHIRNRGVSPMPDLGHVPEHGAIRLGRETTLMTVAHELGHHLVHHHDPLGTADHGNRWVQRFDEAARLIDHLVGTDTP